GAASCTSTAAPTSPVSGSTYAISCALGTLAAGNYGFHFNGGQLTVNKATLEVTANDKSRIYGDANPGFDATISAFKNGETVATSGVTGTASCSSAAKPSSAVPGPYAIGCALGTLAAGNYGYHFTAWQPPVNEALLTVAAISTSKILGVANPTFAATYPGFKNGQTLATSSVTGDSSLTTVATGSSPIGSYTITAAVGSLVSGNYTCSFVNGVLTIVYGTTGFLQPINDPAQHQ